MHPREFGKYRILKLLPLGGMGRVYLALDQQTNKRVALKLIEQGSDPEIEEILEAERRGAILQARLCGVDERIAVIHCFGDMDGFFYIEMEYVEGRDLSEVLQSGPLGVPFAARIGCDICEVLHHAHEFSAEIDGHQYRGIVHGDIKPRNIRITPDGQVKVLDFGIAKALSLTRKFTTNRFGSSQYSSPERLNTGEVDVASDLWSVGVVLYEIVTAKPYFNAETAAKIEHQIRNYRAVRDLPETLPQRFQAILRKALHPDESRRYPSARQFAEDLKAFLQDRVTVAESMPPEDMDATRRSSKPLPSDAGPDDLETRRLNLSDDGATRRTSGSPDMRKADTPAVATPAAAPAAKRPMTSRERRIRFFAGLGVTILVFVLLFNEVASWRSASRLERDIETERLTDMEAAWTQYENIARTSVLPIVHSGARSAIRNRLTAGADRVIADYRGSDAPTVTEADWLRAQASLSRALQLDPDSKDIRGKLHLCEGHINRIRGTARGLSKMLNESRAHFESARELMPKSPDPYLGLARLYVYSLRDVEKAASALREADKKGYDLGRREKTQLADGYRDRGEKLTREAMRATGLEEERDYLERAKDDFRRAEDLYREVVPFGSSAANLRKVFEQLEIIDIRLQAIKEGA